MYNYLVMIYYSAALVNTVGVLLLSYGLTNQTLMETDPTLFSGFGLVMIMIWGLCYYACAQAARTYRGISLVFGLEKLVYCVLWINFVQGDVSWSELYERDLFAGLFYSIYGIIDGFYMSLFFVCAYQTPSILSHSNN